MEAQKHEIGWAILLAVFAVSGCRDESTGEGEGEGEAEAESEAEGEDISIYSIQRGAVAVGTNVTIARVVVTAVDTFDSGNGLGSLYVQEPEQDPVDGRRFSGLYVYEPDRLDSENGDVTDLQPGDVVTVRGTVEEFALESDTSGRTMTEIVDATVEHLGQTNTSMEAVGVSLADLGTAEGAEPWEGVLIRVDDVRALCGPDTRGMVETVGSDGSIEVVFDFFMPDPAPSMDECFASVTGVLNYFFTYRIQPRASDDLVVGSDCTELVLTDIADIQAEPALVEVDSLVRIRGVITAVDANPAEDWGFFVQQGAGARSGIFVYGDEGDAAVGDEVVITGMYQEFEGTTEISFPTVCGIGKCAGTCLPPVPEEVAATEAGSEDWEGVLVRVREVAVTDSNPDAPDDFGAFIVAGALRVDDELYSYGDQPTADTVFSSIIGPIHYSFGNFTLLPRGFEDLVP